MRFDLVVIASLWCASIIVVNPFGDFPLNDDWSMGLSVKRLLETGDFRPTGWTAMPLITHTIWGALFCLPDGFSFEALRFSILTLSLLGILGTYILMRELCRARWFAVTAALTIGFNPIYYALSYTFMTDISFTAITILASVFFVRYLKKGSDFDLLIGTAIAIAATLNRQLGIAFPMAFAISCILRTGFTIRNIIRAAIPPILCIGALFIFEQWLASTGRLPALYNEKNKMLLNSLTNPEMFSNVLNRMSIALHYFGWFLLPLLIGSLGNIWCVLRNKMSVLLYLSIALSVLLSLIIMLLGTDHLMPLSYNIITPAGIGPFTLRDSFIMGVTRMPALSDGFWLVTTVFSFFGGVLLVMAVAILTFPFLRQFWPGRMNDDQAVTVFLLLGATIYLLPILLAGFFDRYLVPAIPFFAACIARLLEQSPEIETRLHSLVSKGLLILFVAFSICGARDYLAWNRVRWEALNDLMENQHILPEDIDGGFEFNGLHLYDPLQINTLDKSWWWVKRDTYVITFRPIPGYSIIHEYRYNHWMPRYTGSIFILKKYQRETGLSP